MNAIIEKFAEAIGKAKEAALSAHRGAGIEHDGGTVNFDQAVIDFTGWKTERIQELAKAAGVTISDKIDNRFFKGCCFIDLPLYGQGMNRTRMAEAAYKSLKENGIPARMYQQSD